MGSILAPSDKVGIRESLHCLEINLESNRIELVTKFLEKRYGKVTAADQDDSSNLPRLECLMELHESDDSNKTTSEFGIGKRTVVTRGHISESSGTVSTLRLGNGRWGTIAIDDTQVDLRCLKIASRFDLEIRVSSPGGFISTSLEVTSGQKIDIGKTVQDLKNKENEASTETGVLSKKSIGQRIRKYTLVIR